MQFDELGAAIVERLQSGTTVAGTRLICIDGPAGAGKTTLAESIARALPSSRVIHMDDLYDGWHETLAEGLKQRLQDWLLQPLAAGGEIRLPRYDWIAGRFGPVEFVPASGYLIVEGVGSGQRAMRAQAELVVFLDVDAETGRLRVSERDGAEVASHMSEWQLLEQSHFAREQTRQSADLYWAWQ